MGRWSAHIRDQPWSSIPAAQGSLSPDRGSRIAGWAYRRWAVGGILPPLFLVRDYWYADWAALGLAAPEPGFQWVRYGPDLLLVNVSTGQVVDVAYGVFY